MNLLQIDNYPWNYIILLLALALAVYIIQTIISYKKNKQVIHQYEEPYRFVTIIKCLTNDFTTEREFNEGDFIGKVEGECPKCKNKLVIISIYATYLQRKK